MPVGNSSTSLSLNHAAVRRCQETAHQGDGRTQKSYFWGDEKKSASPEINITRKWKQPHVIP